MSCDPGEIACELGRIADRMSTFDANAFLSTLLATLVGAGVASLISVIVYRHGRRERKREAVDNASLDLVREVSRHVEEQKQYQDDLNHHEFRSNMAMMKGQSWEAPPTRPDQFAMLASTEALLLVSEKTDWYVANMTRGLIEGLSELKYDTDVESQYRYVRRLIAAWRAGRRTPAEVTGRLNSLHGNLNSLQNGYPIQMDDLDDPFGNWTLPRNLQNLKWK